MTLASFSIDTFLPSLPDIARDLEVPDWQAQQALSLYLLAFAGTTLVYGPLSDAFGRRAVVLGSLALYTLCSIGCAFASNIYWLLAMRVGQGLSASGPVVVGRAIVRDAFSGARAQRVMSHVMLFFALAPAIAPVIGGYLHDAYGWRSVFWFLTGLALVLWAWTVLMLPETLAAADRHPAHPRALALAYWRALLQGRFMLLVLSFALSFSGLFLYIAASPVLLYEHLGYAPSQFGYMFIPIVAGLMAGALISGRLAGDYSHAYAVRVGFAIMLAAAGADLATAVWLAPHLWNTVGPVAVYAAGMALTLPNLSLMAFECLPHRRGLASAVQGFLQMALGGMVAGALVPFVAPRLWTLAAASLALSALALGLWLAYSARSPAPVHTRAP
jgi:DHA1 family bicyclomycin/chloramphenicol resistance-like MFS transporter